MRYNTLMMNKKPEPNEADKPFNYTEWKNSTVKPRALPGWGRKGKITEMMNQQKTLKS